MRIALNDYLRLPTRWRAWLLLSLIVMLLTSIPFSLYITDQRADLLLMMIQVMIGAHFIVSIRTLLVVNTTFARLRQMTGNMDLLQLPGVDAHTLIFGNWQTIIQKAALPHFLLVLPKLGLALGIAQHLHINWTFPQINLCHNYPNNPFCYISHNSISGYIDYDLWNPTILQFSLALAVVLLFTYAEVRLLVALGIWINTTPFNRPETRLIFALLLRVSLVGVALISFNQLYILRSNFLISPSYTCYNQAGNYAPYFNTYFTFDQCMEFQHHRNILRGIDTFQVSLFSLSDHAIMLSANMMRPNLSRQYHMDTLNFEFKPILTLLVEDSNNWWGYKDSQWQISAWRFIFRMFASAILGLVLYSVLTYAFLYSAQQLAVRRGFLSSK